MGKKRIPPPSSLVIMGQEEITLVPVSGHYGTGSLGWREMGPVVEPMEILIWKPLEASGSLTTNASTRAAPCTQEYTVEDCGSVLPGCICNALSPVRQMAKDLMLRCVRTLVPGAYGTQGAVTGAVSAASEKCPQNSQQGLKQKCPSHGAE
jgi:hypothetical protein